MSPLLITGLCLYAAGVMVTLGFLISQDLANDDAGFFLAFVWPLSWLLYLGYWLGDGKWK